jgi:polar amino acid transport system ATP-binding protein
MQNPAAWSDTQPIVSVRDVHKSFGDVEVLKGVSLDVRTGETICIIGPSGSGKSTLLRCINALVDVDAGSILVKGQEVNNPKLDKLALRKKVGMVFQQYNLFPHKTALQNLMMAPVTVLRQDRREVEERARRLITKVRLQGKEDAFPGELSGGQQQRVAIARSLAMNPEVMLFDEVTAALDPETVKEVLLLSHGQTLGSSLKHAFQEPIGNRVSRGMAKGGSRPPGSSRVHDGTSCLHVMSLSGDEGRSL